MVAATEKDFPNARDTANWVHFRPGMTADPLSDERLAEMQRRVKARQPVASVKDHADDDEVQYTTEFARNYRISGAETTVSLPKELPKDFGIRVRILRQRYKLPITVFARKAGLTRQGVLMIETGQRLPGLSTQIAITRALGVPLAYLVGGLDE